MLPETSRAPDTDPNRGGRPEEEKRAGQWTEKDREEILADRPELATDNKGFIRELLRRHAARFRRRKGAPK